MQCPPSPEYNTLQIGPFPPLQALPVVSKELPLPDLSLFPQEDLLVKWLQHLEDDKENTGCLPSPQKIGSPVSLPVFNGLKVKKNKGKKGTSTGKSSVVPLKRRPSQDYDPCLELAETDSMGNLLTRTQLSRMYGKSLPESQAVSLNLARENFKETTMLTGNLSGIKLNSEIGMEYQFKSEVII
jgi:hypothetical protein